MPPSDLALVIVKRCACPVPRAIPLRVLPQAVAFFRACDPPPDLEVQSYRCPRCKTTLILTAADLHLAA